MSPMFTPRKLIFSPILFFFTGRKSQEDQAHRFHSLIWKKQINVQTKNFGNESNKQRFAVFFRTYLGRNIIDIRFQMKKQRVLACAPKAYLDRNVIIDGKDTHVSKHGVIKKVNFIKKAKTAMDGA